MEKELTKEDYELLSTLIKISEKILQTYIELAKLEIINKKTSTKYNNELEKLKMLLKVENEILIKLDCTKLYTMIEEVSKQKSCIEENNEIIDIVANNKINIFPLERVSKLLRNHIITIMANPTKSEIQEEAKEMSYLKRLAVGSTELIRNIENDKWLIFISLLNQKIKENPDIEQKSQLIRTKYYFSYIIPFIEQSLINNNFGPQENIYFSSDLTASLYKISTNVLSFEKSQEAKNTFEEQTTRLLNIEDKEINDKTLEIIIRECLIRVSFQFLEDDELNILNQILYKIIIKLPKTLENNQSLKIIEESFSSMQKDKELIKKVTLG